jgi:hypothetical protein
VVIAHKITDASRGESWYPPLVFPTPCATADVLTVERPARDYAQDAVYDMEAAGYFSMASRISTSELVQTMKVISDNQAHPIETVDARGAEALMAAALPLIELVACKLASLAEELRRSRAAADLGSWTERWRFTLCETQRLETLLLKLQACGRPASAADADLVALRRGAEVLRRLEARSAALPVRSAAPAAPNAEAGRE